MIKLYKKTDDGLLYWETWHEPKAKEVVVHWGAVGDRGETKRLPAKSAKAGVEAVSPEMEARMEDGYAELDYDDMAGVIIEYEGDSVDDLDLRHDLEDRLQETLGWTGLGHCDGGSIGSGTTEVFNYVVDADIAIRVIKDDLAGTKFEGYSRIFKSED